VTLVRRRRSSESSPPPNWLTTYGDMVTLLMTFFVLLFALSTVNQPKFEAIAHSLQATFGVAPAGGPGALPGSRSVLPGGGPLEMNTASKEEAQLSQIRTRLSQYVTENNLSDLVSVDADARGLLIRFSDQVLFDLGKADLRPEATAVLDKVGEAIEDIPNGIRIEGHTDDLPINTPRFPTNWDLSAARAVAVLQYLSRTHRIPKNRLSIAGYGEYRPVARNDSEANRRLNRRVDVVILSMEQSSTEPK